MRAYAENGSITAFERQDSSLLSVLSDANARLISPPNVPKQAAGSIVEYIELA
jgi:molybdopterin molybdotransferase